MTEGQLETPENVNGGSANAPKGAMDSRGERNWWLIYVGPVIAIAVTVLLPNSLPFEGRAVAGIALWMATWWMTEAVPIPVTSLLPLVMFPLVGAGPLDEVAAPYANSVVFLVMGGVILGLATEKTQLHLRVALLTIRVVGTRPSQIVLGLMIASAFLSAWVSNTAAAVIMVPIASSIIRLVRQVDNRAAETKFSASMLLGVAYGVTIGSTATVIGQPPMALMKAYLLESQGFDLGFGQWMLVGVPWAVLMSIVAWLVLTKLVFRPEVDEIPGGREVIEREFAGLGPMAPPEKRVGGIFLVAIFFWVVMPFLAELEFIQKTLPFLSGITDSQVAVAAAVACFIVPSGNANGGEALLSWSASREVPWGLLLLFGGGSPFLRCSPLPDCQTGLANKCPPWLTCLVGSSFWL